MIVKNSNNYPPIFVLGKSKKSPIIYFFEHWEDETTPQSYFFESWKFNYSETEFSLFGIFQVHYFKWNRNFFTEKSRSYKVVTKNKRIVPLFFFKCRVTTYCNEGQLLTCASFWKISEFSSNVWDIIQLIE